jgi:23S rRNA (pseudouridine1915-N3)-methyltransferase
MATELKVVWAGRHRRDRWDELCSEYRRRIRPHLGIDEQVVKVRGHGDVPGRLAAEADALLATLPQPGRWICLDRKGSMLSSLALARRLEAWVEDGPRPVVFVLGSDLGLHDRVLDACHLRLSFGPLTLPHELARLVLYEQVYRAVTIKAGIKYHR